MHAEEKHPSKLQNLKRLLLSEEHVNLQLGLEMLKSMQITPEIWSILYGIWLFEDREEIRENAFALYDATAFAHWPRSYPPLNIYEEQEVSHYLWTLPKDSPLHPNEIAWIALCKRKVGIKYCLEETGFSPERVLRQLCDEQYLSLANVMLEALPPAIGALDHLRTLDLSGNNFKTIPVEIQRLQGLENLYLDGTPLLSEEVTKVEQFFPGIFADKWFGKSTNHFWNGDFQQALLAVDRAIALEATQARYWNTKGVILQRLKSQDLAISCFERSLEIDDKNALTYSNFAYSLHLLNRYQQSLEIAQQGIDMVESHPKSSQDWYGALYFRKGQALFHLKNYESSIHAYQKSIQINPKTSGAWYNQACNFALLGNKQEVIRYLKQAIQLDQRHREEARKDKDFFTFWEDVDFQKITSSP